MSAKITRTANKITKRLDAMISRERAVKGYLARNVYRQYQKAQLERWKTEGKSEGVSWSTLNERYRAAKLSRFAAYPGGGRKMLIARDRLRPSIVGPHTEHRLLVTERSIRIATVTPYASYVNEARNFSVFRRERIREWTNGVRDYVTRGRMT